MSAALLSKLCAKTVNYNGVGGIPDIDWTDVAGGLADCPCQWSYVALTAKWAADLRSQAQLQLLLRHKAKDQIKRANIEHPDGIEYGSKALGNVVYHQYIEGYICGTCKGRGCVSAKDCPVCGGNGRGQWSDRMRAEVMGIAKDTYRRKWRPVVAAVENDLNSWESIGISHLNRQIKPV